MAIVFKCPNCQTEVQVDSVFAGKSGVCPKCVEKVPIPEQDAEQQQDKRETDNEEQS
jgi:DNA-directed RNA polymerase subunit RPC12/RpoP